MLISRLLTRDLYKKNVFVTSKINTAFIYKQWIPLSTKSITDRLDLVKQLRTITKEGVKYCKEALEQSNWDLNTALTLIRGRQINNEFAFDKANLKFGRIVAWEGYNSIAFAELKCNCDFVASSSRFSDLCQTVCKSIVNVFKSEEYKKDTTNSITINSLDLNEVCQFPVYNSTDKLNVGDLIKQVSSGFKVPIALDNVYTCQGTDKSILGLYVHQSVVVDDLLIGNRLGSIHLKCNIREDHFETLRKIANTLSLQLVANPLISNIDDSNLMEEFLLQPVLMFDDFNKYLLHLCNSTNIKTSISHTTTVLEALNYINDVISAEISVNGLIHIHCVQDGYTTADSVPTINIEHMMRTRSKAHVEHSISSYRDDFIFEKPKDTLVEFLVHGYSIFNLSEKTCNLECNNYNLMIIKNDCKGMLFYELYDSFNVERFEDTLNVRMYIKCFDLNIESDIIRVNHTLELLKTDVNLIIEVPVSVMNGILHFCLCSKENNEIIIWVYDPHAKTEFKNEASQNPPKYIRDYLSSWRKTKFVSSRETMDLIGLINYIINELKLDNDKCEDLKCRIKSLYDVIKLNYTKIIDRSNESPKTIMDINNSDDNFDGWRIDRCYLDINSANSLSLCSYLDDSTINFFNEFIRKYIMDAEQKQRWCILNTFFLRKISQYNNPREAYDNTWRWTRKIKRPLSLHDIIFIPINIHGIHWSLVIIAYPKFAIRCIDDKTLSFRSGKKNSRKATIIYLDSLGQYDLEDKICNLLKNYLSCEYENKCKKWNDKGFKFMNNSSSWDYVGGLDELPLQENGHDCGVYILEYIKHLIKNTFLFKKLLSQVIEDDLELKKSRKIWFTQKQVHQRRINMMEMLFYMKDNPNWENDNNCIEYLLDKMMKEY